MKRLLTFQFLTLVLFTTNVKAENVFGSDISWKRLSNDTFQVKFEIYTDCSRPLDSIHPTIIPSQCSAAFTVDIGKPISKITENLTPRCYKDRSKCDQSPTLPYGIDRNTFIYKIYLGPNGNCCWYKIVLAGLTRDSQISNGNANTLFETSAELDWCLATNSESIIFQNRPLALFYNSTDVSYFPGALQSNGDSLSFTLQTPTNASFNTPYSATYPFTCYGGNVKATTSSPFKGFGIENSSGTVTFHSLANGFFIFRIEARQWKMINSTYTLVGISNREMIYLLVTKPITNPPMLSGPFSYITHPGQMTCITVNSSDQDPEDTTRIVWDRKLPGTFDSNNGKAKNASATICWTPTDEDESCFPYTFSITAYDDNCIQHQQTTKQYQILVRPTMKSTRVYTRMNCHTYQFLSRPINRSGCLSGIPYSVSWYEPKLIGTGSPNKIISLYDSLRYDFVSGGQYIVKSILAADGVVNSYFDTIVVDSFASVNIINRDTVLSIGDSLLLRAETKKSNGSNAYEWWANGELIDTASNVMVKPKQSTTYTVLNKALSTPCDIVEDNVTLIIPGSTGIKNQKEISSIIKSNPFDEEITLQNIDFEFSELILYSLEGKKILSTTLVNGVNRINTKDICSGSYFITLLSVRKITQYKLIKK